MPLQQPSAGPRRAAAQPPRARRRSPCSRRSSASASARSGPIRRWSRPGRPRWRRASARRRSGARGGREQLHPAGCRAAGRRPGRACRASRTFRQWRNGSSGRSRVPLRRPRKSGGRAVCWRGSRAASRAATRTSEAAPNRPVQDEPPEHGDRSRATPRCRHGRHRPRQRSSPSSRSRGGCGEGAGGGGQPRSARTAVPIDPNSRRPSRNPGLPAPAIELTDHAQSHGPTMPGVRRTPGIADFGLTCVTIA